MKGNSKLQIDFRPKLLAALRTYSKEKFAGDLMAGIIVGIVALPLAIFTTQIKDLLGLTVDHMPGDFLTKWVVYAESITTISWPAVVVGLVSIAIIVLTPRVSKRVPGSLATIRIIRMRKVPFMDSTGLHNLESLCRLSHREGITVVLSGVNDNVRAMLIRSGMDARLGADNICSNIQEALARARALLE